MKELKEIEAKYRQKMIWKELRKVTGLMAGIEKRIAKIEQKLAKKNELKS